MGCSRCYQARSRQGVEGTQVSRILDWSEMREKQGRKRDSHRDRKAYTKTTIALNISKDVTGFSLQDDGIVVR